MLKIRDAKPLFALTVLLAPWDLLLFTRADAWGATFVFGRFVRIGPETQLLNPVALFDAYRSLGASGTTGLVVTAIWALCALVATVGAAYTLYGRLFVGGTTVGEDRAVGVAFGAAGGVFLLSRLAVTLAGSLDWRSVPVGALYVVFVGVVFYCGLFRFDAS